MAKKKPRSGWRKADPNQAREAKRYDNPIPSREFILEYLAEAGSPVPHDKVVADMGLNEEEAVAVQRRLDAMVRDGQLVRNRRRAYGPADKMDLARGRVVGHPDGYGFLIPDGGGDDLYLSPRQMRGIIHGDRVLARTIGVDNRGRREGAVVEVLERNTARLVGRLFDEGPLGVVVPDHQRVQHDILVLPEDRGGAEAGQIVVVELTAQPDKHARPKGRIVEVLGDHMGPGMEIDIAIRSHGLPHQWPAEVEEELKAFGHEVPKAQKKGREDLRGLPLVTIDGADAKDFDDAVYCERKSKGWRLLVAIADVSAYVTPGSALDAEAAERGTSVYFPGRVVPMLPELLSNGLCSLNPEVDRLCMVCEMYVNREGRITRSRFLEGVMRSHARLTYDEVAAMVLEGDEALRERHQDVLPHLEELHNLYQVLRTAREARGAIDFETTETSIVFGPDKKIDRIVPVARNDAHKLIEECMIAANVAAARFVSRHKVPALYRVHEPPSGDKLTDLREFLAGVGLSLGGGDKPSPKDYEAVIRRVEGRPDQHLIHTVLLRSMSQAVYSPDNNGHFGLALDTYAHFTSPIRRYPDLLLHRAIRHALRGGKARDFDYGKADMVTLGETCSSTERRADEATRDAESWLKCEYMMDKVGEEFDGVISGVTSFGLFVELSGIYVEGLAHVTSLGDDYYHFDPVRRRLQGERSGRIFGLADPIRVKVVRVSLDDRKIDFEPVEAAAAKPKKKSGGRRRRRR